MNCLHFGLCGSCTNYEGGYEAQLQRKISENQERFSQFFRGDIVPFRSPTSHYRARAEFRIWHEGNETFYAMTSKEKQPFKVEDCPQVNLYIEELMPLLLEELQQDILRTKLFGCDFLSSKDGDMVVSLLYHKKLDEVWEQAAKKVAIQFDISIIGRSRKQKIVLGKDYVMESLHVNSKKFIYKHIENSFTQPNPKVNEQMIEWTLEGIKGTQTDLLELYCGAGNFTIPFATKFRKVLATEISKASIAAAKENMRYNNIENIEFVRMSVEEFTQALDGVRDFNRMRHIDLKEYDLQTIFVDPPRAGMDEKSCHFATRFENIIYISCNPETLVRDLEILTQTHNVIDMALF
ncbi:MAG: tRNA (uridine(54)-C5)-methyltransferase TrmA, partial [Epsilonproteobacteria bacterium]|nr:tRNA (uridine(54)-C5)-methyltransferase TrmA [Campylobacterota bacterium]